MACNHERAHCAFDDDSIRYHWCPDCGAIRPLGCEWTFPLKELTFNEWQRERILAQREALPFREAISLGAMGLAGETGESVELIKKHLFHGKPLARDRLLTELGDVLWYISYLANANGATLEEIARLNSAKLTRRYPEGFSVEAASKTTGDDSCPTG